MRWMWHFRSSQKCHHLEAAGGLNDLCRGMGGGASAERQQAGDLNVPQRDSTIKYSHAGNTPQTEAPVKGGVLCVLP